MNDIYKQIKINLNFSYLIIARQNVSKEKYNNIKTQIFKDFERIR